MTHDEAMLEVEIIIDAQWREFIAAFEARLRSDGLNEGDIAAMLNDSRLDWYEQKTRQLRDVRDELFAKLH